MTSQVTNKTRSYSKEYEKKLKRWALTPGRIEAERERVKLAQRKRRSEDPSINQRARERQRKLREDKEYLASNRKATKEWRKRRISECQAIINEWKSQGCCVCGETARCCIDAHHKNQSEKEYAIGHFANGSKSPPVIKKELAKCIAICGNCHRKYHDGADQVVVAAVVAITGQPWKAVEGVGIRNGNKEKKAKNKLGPFGKPIYKEDEDRCAVVIADGEVVGATKAPDTEVSSDTDEDEQQE